MANIETKIKNLRNTIKINILIIAADLNDSTLHYFLHATIRLLQTTSGSRLSGVRLQTSTRTRQERCTAAQAVLRTPEISRKCTTRCSKSTRTDATRSMPASSRSVAEPAHEADVEARHHEVAESDQGAVAEHIPTRKHQLRRDVDARCDDDHDAFASEHVARQVDPKDVVQKQTRQN